MKTTVFYHSADYDGIFCREVAKKFLGEENVEYVGWDFKNDPLIFPPEGKVYVLDLPVDRLFGMNFDGAVWLDIFNRLVWIDHHKSSIDSHPAVIGGYRIDGVAACWRLAQAGKA
jgi:hypothetical protein